MRRVVTILLLAAAASFAADRDLLKLVMPDARVVSGINVAQVKKTPFGQFVLSEFSAAQDPEFDGFVKASGFDPRQHLTEIIIASPAGTERERRLFVVRGIFEPARIIEIARAAGATIEPYQGVDILSSGPVAASPTAMPMSFAFLSTSIALAGDPESVRGAIDRREKGTGPGAAIAAKIDALSTTSDAWFVSTVPVAELAQGLPSANLSGALKEGALKAIEQASGGATFGTAVKFSAELVAQTPKDAASLTDVLRFLSGLLVTGPQQPLLTGLDLRAEGKLVKVAAAIPEAQLESLIRQTGK